MPTTSVTETGLKEMTSTSVMETGLKEMTSTSVMETGLKEMTSTSVMETGLQEMTSASVMGGGSNEIGATSNMVENAIENMRVRELKEMAKSKGIKKYYSLGRAELLKALEPARPVPKPSLSKMSAKQLRVIAKGRGIKKYYRLKKGELLKALKPSVKPVPKSRLIRQTDTAIKGYIRSYEIKLLDKMSPIDQLSKTRGVVSTVMSRLIESMQGVKVNETLEVRFKKEVLDGIKLATFYERAYINSGPREIVNEGDSSTMSESMMEKILSVIDTWIRHGSGWVVDSIKGHYLNVAKYNPLNGSSYIDLPTELKNSSKGLVNIKNEDNECFRWCHVRLLSPRDVHPERVTKSDRELAKELNYSGVEFPVSQKHYKKIETQNNIGVNVFGYEGKRPFPIYLSRDEYDKVINLLQITKGDNRHYVLIKDFNKFMYNQTNHKERKHFCMYCLQCFSSEETLSKHKDNCITINGKQSVQMPEIGRDYVKFINHHRKLEVPFVIYADFEAITQKVHGCSKSGDVSFTEAYQNHIDCGYGYKVVCRYDDRFTKDVKVYRGKGSIYKFLEDMLRT